MTQAKRAFAKCTRRLLFQSQYLLGCFLAILFLLIAVPSAGQSSDENEEVCANPTENSDLRIGACTALIQFGDPSTEDLATAYNNRGNGYKDKGEYDRAIRDFDQAVKLKPDYLLALYNRGNAYDAKGDYGRAIQDYDQAIQLKPDDDNVFYAFYGRGYAYNAKGDYNHAIQDYDRAIQLRPNDANTFIVRGISNFLRADFSSAVMDFQHSGELNPSIAYVVLWLHLARKRLGQDDIGDLAERSTKADQSRWPAPILELYMGRMTQNRMMKAAASLDSDQQKRQLCEANFFAGEEELLHRRHMAGKALLKAALDGCPRTNLHYDAAAAELRRLNASAASSTATVSSK